jgi:hypothetical protein
MNYRKNIGELQKQAVMWWPDSLKKKASSISVIPTLVDSQEEFISILKLSKKSPHHVFDVLKASEFPANLFLKHLSVLSDYGGETIQRLNKNFSSVFSYEDNSKPYMDSFFIEKSFRYEFQSLPVRGSLTNKKLGIDGKSISNSLSMNPTIYDMAMILLYGSNAVNTSGADLDKCEIGTLLGSINELDEYIRQKYIWVSRITGGATANTQGQLAQTVVATFLRENLNNTYSVTRNGQVKMDSYNNPTSFDVLVEKDSKCVGIEISFQVTTNSTIERKAGQAQDRQSKMHEMDYKIAYVIDGAGNFQRRSAISTICSFSDCTVAYSEQEFVVLLDFIKKYLNEIY